MISIPSLAFSVKGDFIKVLVNLLKVYSEQINKKLRTDYTNFRGQITLIQQILISSLARHNFGK